jgi:hypothetical protein
MESALPLASYLNALPADDAMLASGLLGALAISAITLLIVGTLAALLAPVRGA